MPTYLPTSLRKTSQLVASTDAFKAPPTQPTYLDHQHEINTRKQVRKEKQRNPTPHLRQGQTIHYETTYLHRNRQQHPHDSQSIIHNNTFGKSKKKKTPLHPSWNIYISFSFREHVHPSYPILSIPYHGTRCLPTYLKGEFIFFPEDSGSLHEVQHRQGVGVGRPFLKAFYCKMPTSHKVQRSAMSLESCILQYNTALKRLRIWCDDIYLVP